MCRIDINIFSNVIQEYSDRRAELKLRIAESRKKAWRIFNIFEQ